VTSTCFEHPSVHPHEDTKPIMEHICHCPDCLYGCMKEMP